jgi:hypothetical protein
MTMTIRELIELLEDVLVDSGNDDHVLGDDTEVLLVSQPYWPLAHTFLGVHVDRTVEEGPVIWLVEGGHPSNRSPYGPSEAFEECTRG